MTSTPHDRRTGPRAWGGRGAPADSAAHWEAPSAGDARRDEGGAPMARQRRRKAIRHVIADSAMTHAGVAMLARLLPPARVHLTRYEVVVPRLPRRLDGLRVLHLTDLHLHPGSDLAWQVPELVASAPHELTCYTGDFIDVDADIPSVAALMARMPHAEETYAVFGNHDYIPFGRTHGANDTPRLRSVLTDAGITVLTNESRALYGGELFVVGVDDPATERDDLDHALRGVPEDACALMLAHSPDVILRLAGRQPSLILAGHTHGGQIRLPRVGALLTLSQVPKHLAMGLGHYEGVTLFVSRGIGYSGMNVRLGSPSEVALLTLRSPMVARAHGSAAPSTPHD